MEHKMMFEARPIKDRAKTRPQFRDVCPCGYKGRWQSTAGLAHSEWDHHLEAATDEACREFRHQQARDAAAVSAYAFDAEDRQS